LSFRGAREREPGISRLNISGFPVHRFALPRNDGDIQIGCVIWTAISTIGSLVGWMPLEVQHNLGALFAAL
jgi:hypothetical protein